PPRRPCPPRPHPPPSTLFPYTTLFRSTSTETVVEPLLDTSRDSLPLRLMSNATMDEGVGPTARICAGCKVPSPLPSSTETLLEPDRKSTRLNSSHVASSYAVFCSKKKM